MAYVLIEKDFDAEVDNAWKNVVDETGKELVFQTKAEMQAWVLENRTYPDSVRSVEVPDNY
jgi:hypothetical protein